jgi:hypothetical protein
MKATPWTETAVARGCDASNQTSDYWWSERPSRGATRPFWRRVPTADGLPLVEPPVIVPPPTTPVKGSDHLRGTRPRNLGMRSQCGWKFVLQLAGSGGDPDAPGVGRATTGRLTRLPCLRRRTLDLCSANGERRAQPPRPKGGRLPAALRHERTSSAARSTSAARRQHPRRCAGKWRAAILRFKRTSRVGEDASHDANHSRLVETQVITRSACPVALLSPYARRRRRAVAASRAYAPRRASGRRIRRRAPSPASRAPLDAPTLPRAGARRC